jgi:5-methylthioadenosine/S-adenosylhomocysteine deaminase
MLVLRGTVVTMRPGGAVLAQGEVYAGDDGLIAAVTPGDPAPPGFQDAPRVAAGGLIYPGLIDLHNHLLYNSLPLWTEPSRSTPWQSHNEWVQDDDAPTYRTRVSAPARLLGAAAGRALLRYVETRALVGGTTCIQGNPRGATPPDGELVRNIDTERLGTNRTSSGSGRSSPAGRRTWRTSSPRSGSTAGSSAMPPKAPCPTYTRSSSCCWTRIWSAGS